MYINVKLNEFIVGKDKLDFQLDVDEYGFETIHSFSRGGSDHQQKKKLNTQQVYPALIDYQLDDNGKLSVIKLAYSVTTNAKALSSYAAGVRHNSGTLYQAKFNYRLIKSDISIPNKQSHDEDITEGYFTASSRMEAGVPAND